MRGLNADVVNPYPRILETKSKTWEYTRASFMETKSNTKMKNPVLGTFHSVISGNKIQQFFLSIYSWFWKKNQILGTSPSVISGNKIQLKNIDQAISRSNTWLPHVGFLAPEFQINVTFWGMLVTLVMWWCQHINILNLVNFIVLGKSWVNRVACFTYIWYS